MKLDELKVAKQINTYLFKPLAKIEKKLNRLDVASCNGEIEEEEYFKKSEYLENKANKILAEFDDNDLLIYHQTDPRGCSLYIIDKAMDKSNYTNGLAIL